MSWTKQGFKEILEKIDEYDKTHDTLDFGELWAILEEIRDICRGVLGIDPVPKRKQQKGKTDKHKKHSDCTTDNVVYTPNGYLQLFKKNDWETPTIAFGE